MSNKQSAIIFGSNGQDGYFLSRLLENLNIEVFNVSRTNAAICGTVTDYDFVQGIVKKVAPGYIFNFAASSSTKHEFLFENHDTISTGTLNILESVRLFSPKTRVFISGSALQFRNEGKPIDESTAFEASSPYSIARIQSVYAARYYRKAFGLDVFTGYFFNHDSPLRSERHVNQKIVRAVQRIASGSKEKLVLGNIEVRKEFGYAGDVVDAIWKLVNQDSVSEAVIGIGEAHPIKAWVEYCFSLKKLQWQEHTELQNDYVPEYDILVSNPGLIKSTGWTPTTDFYQLANMMMNANAAG